jgi:hypothetical protein
MSKLNELAVVLVGALFVGSILLPLLELGVPWPIVLGLAYVIGVVWGSSFGAMRRVVSLLLSWLMGKFTLLMGIIGGEDEHSGTSQEVTSYQTAGY